MTVLHRVSLVGFGTFERATFELFFRMAEQRARRIPAAADTAAQRQRGYVQTALVDDAEIVLINGDDKDALLQAAAWPHRCVCVGGKPPLQGALASLPRPLNMTALLKLLDQVMESGGRAPQAAPPAAIPAAASVTSGGGSSGLLQGTTTAQASVPGAEILVVDDSDIALKFMARCLARYNLAVQLASSGEEALQHVAAGRFEFVFLDVSMPGIDGYQTCKLIKKRPYLPGRKAPKVVMLTSRGGMVDKMRGTLSGCDAYLTKPLQQDELLKLIAPHFLESTGQSQTTRSAPLSSLLGL